MFHDHIGFDKENSSSLSNLYDFYFLLLFEGYGLDLQPKKE